MGRRTWAAEDHEKDKFSFVSGQLSLPFNGDNIQELTSTSQTPVTHRAVQSLIIQGVSAFSPPESFQSQTHHILKKRKKESNNDLMIYIMFSSE